MILTLLPVCLHAQRQRNQKLPDTPVVSHPASNAPMLLDAKKLLLKGNDTEAEEIMRKYLERYPDDPAGYYELARIMAGRQAFEEALVLAGKAYDRDPENIWYQLFLAETCQMVQDYDRALKIYEEIVTRHPENLEYFYQLATLQLGLGKYSEAIGTYNEIEQRTGINEEISLQKQKIYLHLKDYRKAEAEINRLIDAFPEETRYYGILAEFYMSLDRREEALQTYQKILDLEPENAYIHMTLADYYRKEGDRERSYQELKLGFANPNLDVDTKINILLSFYTINEIVSDLKYQAFELSELLVKTHPEDPKVYSIYGDLLSQDKQYEKARDAFLQVIALDSSRYIVWEELLRMDILISDSLHLTRYGNLSLELFPEQPVLYLFTALGEFQLKQFENAAKLLNRGVLLVAGNNELSAQFYMYLGDTYHALNRVAESDAAYEKSLKFKPDNAYVLNNYSYYLTLRGMALEKAEQMAKKAVTLEPDNPSFQDTYGWVLYKLGQYPEAREWIEKAVSDPAHASGEVMEHYGDVLYRLGEKQEALIWWRKALEKGGGSDLLNRKCTEQKLIEE